MTSRALSEHVAEEGGDPDQGLGGGPHEDGEPDEGFGGVPQEGEGAVDHQPSNWRAQRRDDMEVGGHDDGQSPQRGAPPPDRRYRASSKSLKWDIDWFMDGAPTSEGVKLRGATLSDGGAKDAVNRFLMLVQFTDERHGHTPPGRVVRVHAKQ